ncbi:MAG: protein kinase [Dokdonella sp.]
MIEIPGYRLLRQLGRGGMATVYLAVQESVDREVALKIMSPALLVDPNFGERFMREAKIAAHLHHRHVVGIHDVGRAGDYHYIAMEYLAGGQVLAGDGSASSPTFALRVTSEIAGALNYAHEKGFVHRDVKPDNILLRTDRSSALTDFGIARALDAAPRVTRTGTIVGTPHYMSPEQARGKKIDGRSDLYALGVVLYELLTGRVPYHADDSLAIGIMHITQPVPVLPKGLAVLQPLIDRLLAKQPEDRFQTGNEVAAAIAAIELSEFDETLPGLVAIPNPQWHDASSADTVIGADAIPSIRAPARDRAEPNLGRLDEIINARDDDVMRADRIASAPPRRTPKRKSRRGLIALVALAVLVVAAGVAWNNQDGLRRLLPRTEFNDTLSRAQKALDAGRLTGHQGDSARELFLAAHAQDQDNDIARRGLQTVGQRLLEIADADMQHDDLAAAREALDAARDLLGGGTEIDRLDRALKQVESRGSETAQLLDHAGNALRAGKIVGADGAAMLYQSVLDSDKANALALAGLKKSADTLASQARGALAAKDIEGATARANDISRILPSYPGLPELLGQIAQTHTTERASLDATLDRADAQIRAGQLSGSDDSALDLFRSVLKQDPANARAKEGLRGVAQAFVVQANAALDDSNPDQADKLLNAAAAIAPASPDLRAARVELRELRERLDINAERAVVSPSQAAQVRKLVAAAVKAAAAGNLIIPPGDCAYDKYRAALAIDGNDKDALDGLARLPARAKELFAQALTEGAPQRARASLDAVRQVAPDDVAIATMAERLARAFLDQADARMSEGRRADATRALDAARELRPGDPRLAPLQARLRAMADGPGTRNRL